MKILIFKNLTIVIILLIKSVEITARNKFFKKREFQNFFILVSKNNVKF